MADEPREWIAELVRALQAQQHGLAARLDRAERDIQEHDREMIAHTALAVHEHREMRDEYLKALEACRDEYRANAEAAKTRDAGLRAWAISVLGALVVTLLAFIANNLGKFVSASIPK